VILTGKASVYRTKIRYIRLFTIATVYLVLLDVPEKFRVMKSRRNFSEMRSKRLI